MTPPWSPSAEAVTSAGWTTGSASQRESERVDEVVTGPTESDR